MDCQTDVSIPVQLIPGKYRINMDHSILHMYKSSIRQLCTEHWSTACVHWRAHQARLTPEPSVEVVVPT